MEIGIGATLTTDFDDAVARAREALKERGFGVLTEIDMQATLKAKIGADVDRYLILGACNPTLAHRALGIDPRIGLLLPCNVVVRADGDTVVVEAMNPQLMVEVTRNAELAAVAEEAAGLLRAAIGSLAD
ncbi:DUF302 domain-containing protein [Rhodococcus olei]|uniref:DUF302 domain-containing protein n=1 Tax=Rhodococcus olei TaxID=2161675 RepID=A0ABP8P220_9NOCA